MQKPGVMQSPSLPNLSGLVCLSLALVLLMHYSALTLPGLLPWMSPSCAQECLDTYFSYLSISQKDPDFVEAVRNRYIYPRPAHPDTSPFDARRPVWRELLEWDKVQEMLMDLWRNEPPGTFVEIGAVDGEFMSQTLTLERNLSWSGLLVEPDPRSFAILRNRRRNASLSPLCVHEHPSDLHLFWMMDLIKDLPQEYQALMMARSKMSSETIKGDERQGRSTLVRCVPLSTLLLAGRAQRTDFLSVATGLPGDDKLLRGVLKEPEVFDIKTILVQYTRNVLKENPYPALRGYVYDMERSFLMTRLYWRRSHCKLLEKGTTCKRFKHYDLAEACFKYLCSGFATVWSYT
ncbi:uncharacterized protein LOC122244871 [Penaeus japonicus]|uniref:uncharacterized protein LOC122244871 n=1 Tax=Penaeus japonicus TaxID=27405 RepID=UPI001C716128|nr:uncharacterized protein LOC122244871 [Penaeus japonicus]